jgi:hypothetical protein
MPYAFITPDGNIKSVVNKLSPFMKVLEGERIVDYNPPEFDNDLEACTPRTPVDPQHTTVVFDVAPKSGADKKAITTRRLSAYLQARMDAAAQVIGYDSMISACSYASSTHPVYGPEGAYCVQWRDECWGALFGLIDAAFTDGGQAPTTGQLDAALPTFAPPPA